MKKITTVLVIISMVISFFACKEQCEKDNTGELTIVNKTERAIWFDVTEGSSTNENRLVQSGAKTTYTMPNTKVKIWASHTNVDSMFFMVKTQVVARCEEIVYETSAQACKLTQSIDTVTITNNTGFDGVINLQVQNGYPEFQGEVTLANGASHSYYNVNVGSGVMNYIITVNGVMRKSANIEIAACDPEFRYTWNP